MSGINEFMALQLTPKNLTYGNLTVVAGGDDQEVLAAEVGKRYRIYGVQVTQVGTAASLFTVKHENGKTVLAAKVPNDGTPVSAQLSRNYVEGELNSAVQVNVVDQASDDAQVEVWYTLEDN